MTDTKKIYSEPEAEIIRFEGADVITASGDHETMLPIVRGSTPLF